MLVGAAGAGCTGSPWEAMNASYSARALAPRPRARPSAPRPWRGSSPSSLPAWARARRAFPAAGGSGCASGDATGNRSHCASDARNVTGTPMSPSRRGSSPLICCAALFAAPARRLPSPSAVARDRPGCSAPRPRWAEHRLGYRTFVRARYGLDRRWCPRRARVAPAVDARPRSTSADDRARTAGARASHRARAWLVVAFGPLSSTTLSRSRSRSSTVRPARTRRRSRFTYEKTALVQAFWLAITCRLSEGV